MLSRYFLDRPVFAWVITIGIMVFGVLAIVNLPISQYPNIAPPSISVSGMYPGASAETVENTVTQIVEQKMTGLDNMLYLSASSDSSGRFRMELTFSPGTDPDLAWAKVQNKLQLAMPSLPDVVQRSGLNVRKATRNYLLMANFISEDPRISEIDLRDYMQSNIEKVIARVPGVGEVEVFGTQYAMRIWLNPDKLTAYSLTTQDVVQAVATYNVEVSAGQLGRLPAVEGQRLNVSMVVQNLLETPEEFGRIPIVIQPDGSVVRVRDVGRVELGTDSYDMTSKYNGMPSAGLAVRLEPGANALDTANLVKQRLAELSQYFPAGMKVTYPYDTTPFIQVSIQEVVKTLIEAIVLVFLVMWLFMGNMRATLIPTIAVPVVLLGTFGVIWMLGFSINMLTMFAMVLAIGLLVDDAIVVVENVERIMSEEGLPPREATMQSMDQITSALIGIGVVLSAVFGPMACFSGSTGVIYRQFSGTIIAAMLLSVVVALILTPVLCASLLRPVPKGHEPAENAVWFLRWFFLGFDRVFYALRDFYVWLVGYAVRRWVRFILAYICLLGVIYYVFQLIPTGFLPDEDQGVLAAQILLPPGATAEQTQAVADRVQNYLLQQEKDAVASCMTIVGAGFGGVAQNNGMVYIKLKDWHLRDRPELKAQAVANRAMMVFSKFRDGIVFVFPPPPIPELGTAMGFDFQLQDRSGVGHQALMEARNQLLAMAARDPRLQRVRHNGMDDLPEYRVDVDWERTGTLSLPITAVHSTLSSAFGGAYVNDFVQGGRVKRVYVQFDTPFRMQPEDLKRVYVRNTHGKMVPFTAFATTRWSIGSPRLERYNAFPSLNIWGEPAPGHSSGEAMQAMEELASELPPGIGYDWTGTSYQERMATSQAPILYAFSVLVIFLCVAALYESWTIPFVNLLMLPLGVFGAMLFTWLRGLPNDVYFQIGFLTTMGLSTKNAILIIQFIRHQMEHGAKLVDATLAAVRIRFRPVMMTSLAFFFGTLPLAIATGAGAGAMNAIGTAVTGGMVSATMIDLLYIPLLFVVVSRFFARRMRSQISNGSGDESASTGGAAPSADSPAGGAAEHSGSQDNASEQGGEPDQA